VRADRRFVAEILRLLEFAHHLHELCRRLRLRNRISARRVITLRGLMHAQLRNTLQIEHEIEALAARRVAAARPLEVERAHRDTCGNDSPVRLGAVEVGLISPVDSLLGTGANARVAARAKIEIDRILLRPCDGERAEPTVYSIEVTAIDRKFALGRQLRA